MCHVKIVIKLWQKNCCQKTASQSESLCLMVEFINRNKCPFASGPEKENKLSLLGLEKEKKCWQNLWDVVV